jgi:hypothetical protein
MYMYYILVVMYALWFSRNVPGMYYILVLMYVFYFSPNVCIMLKS